MKISIKSKNLYYASILAIILGCIIVSIIFFPHDPKAQGELKIEFIKGSIQLFLISIAGGIFIYEFNHIREKSRNRNDFKKHLLTNIAKNYLKAKKVRRILEANIIKNDGASRNMNYSALEIQMSELIDAQLEFEFAHTEEEVFSDAFKNKVWTNLKNETKILETYLNDIITEYQHSNPINGIIDVNNSILLNEFVFDTAMFKAKFSNHFHNTVKLLQGDILEYNADFKKSGVK